MFVKRSPHKVIVVKNTNGEKKKVCKCQLKEEHLTEDEKINFPVYECPEMTRKYGFGAEDGLQ